jgi:hypothetical protein
MSKDLVVFSIDFTITRSLGVIGELASFRGLKFRITFNILLAIRGRARTRREREFKVALTRTVFLPSLARVRLYWSLNVHGTLLEYSKHSIEKARCFSFEISLWYEWMIFRDK